jgi:hypothetical protein
MMDRWDRTIHLAAPVVPLVYANQAVEFTSTLSRFSGYSDDGEKV